MSSLAKRVPWTDVLGRRGGPRTGKRAAFGTRLRGNALGGET